MNATDEMNDAPNIYISREQRLKANIRFIKRERRKGETIGACGERIGLIRTEILFARGHWHDA